MLVDKSKYIGLVQPTSCYFEDKLFARHSRTPALLEIYPIIEIKQFVILFFQLALEMRQIEYTGKNVTKELGEFKCKNGTGFVCGV